MITVGFKDYLFWTTMRCAQCSQLRFNTCFRSCLIKHIAAALEELLPGDVCTVTFKAKLAPRRTILVKL